MLTIRLWGHATRSHAQESENPIDNIEQHSPYSDGSNVGRRTEVSYDGNIDSPSSGTVIFDIIDGMAIRNIRLFSEDCFLSIIL